MTHAFWRPAVAMVTSVVLLGACTLFREEMVLKGKVLEMDGDMALVSVHSTKDTHPGQPLEVYKVNLVPAVKHTANPWRRPERSGSAVLTEVIGPHAVRVQITNGIISTDHDVELRGKR